MTDDAEAFRGTRIFLAEDHFAIAIAMSSMLEDLGCTIVAEAASTAAAEDVAAGVDADCALLDINMGDGTCYAAAERCRERGIPVIFTTGYDDPPDLPPHLADAPRLLKPVALTDLRRALRPVAVRS